MFSNESVDPRRRRSRRIPRRFWPPLLTHRAPAVSARPAARRVMTIPKVVQNVVAVTGLGIAETHHLAQLALLQSRPPRYLVRTDTKLCDRALVQHKNSAGSPVRILGDDASPGEHGETAPHVLCVQTGGSAQGS